MSWNPRSQSTCKTKKMQTHLILVGLLFFCSLPLSHSQACRPNLLKNVNFPGEDITFHYSPDVEHCQKLCTQYPKCFFFTHYQADWIRDNKQFYCYLKFSDTGEPSAQTPLVGVTSGFSLKSCNPEKLLCLDKVYTNVGFLGTDYKSLLASSYEACQRVCTQDPLCQFFTFMQSNYTLVKIRHKCHLKYSWSIPRVPSVNTLTGVVSGFSNRIQVHQNFTNACVPKIFDNKDIEGTDLESMPAASLEHCQALCSVHPCCTVFSYDSNSNACKLKSNQEVKVKNGQIKSGLPVFECLMNDNWVTKQHNGVDFKGCGFKTVQETTDAKMCQQACNDDRNCQFYTYIKKDFSDTTQRRRCYLKRVITMPLPLKVIVLQKAVSGFSTNICV